ncbi:MAG: hypothetical protein Faunusvirus2_61 [Faunusvirus sp.]|uniref:Uncharacterized protein n=1 Tax=Faunusvirus sp. TaxID=2487766 RepID=A0A3G4ZXP6_9VIRU|nr:MAG: hypothetical protein Faunusvirus2_61 [Faunusvirus sp.]
MIFSTAGTITLIYLIIIINEFQFNILLCDEFSC